MSQRLQILIDEPRYRILTREAERTGKSVAQLIRESVDQAYGMDRTQRSDALARLLSEKPMLVEEWATEKAALLRDLTEPKR